MSTWSKDELRKIADTDDLHISPFREDGKAYGTPTWIWSVVVDDALYVRAYNGQNSRWYQAAMLQKAGRISAAGMTKEVSLEPVKGRINDSIDDGYRAKYKTSPYLKPMIGQSARSATVKVVPRKTEHVRAVRTRREVLKAGAALVAAPFLGGVTSIVQAAQAAGTGVPVGRPAHARDGRQAPPCPRPEQPARWRSLPPRKALRPGPPRLSELLAGSAQLEHAQSYAAQP